MAAFHTDEIAYIHYQILGGSGQCAVVCRNDDPVFARDPDAEVIDAPLTSGPAARLLNRLLDDWHDDELTLARSKRQNMIARQRESKDLKPRTRHRGPKAPTLHKSTPSAHEDPNAFLASYSSAPVVDGLDASPRRDDEPGAATRRRRASGAQQAKKRRPRGVFGFK